MEGSRVDECLWEALEADDPSEKDYHVRQAIQLLRADDDSQESGFSPMLSKKPVGRE